jgi:hypothetical protein
MSKLCKPCINPFSNEGGVLQLVQSELGGGDGKPTEYFGIDGVTVDKVELQDRNEVTIGYQPYLPLGIISFTNNRSALRARGNTITDITFDWTYNKSVEEQSISGGAISETPVNSARTLFVDDLTIDTNTTFTLTADDIVDDDINPVTATTQVRFGNFIYFTAYTTNDRDDIDATLIDNIFNTNFPKQLRVNKNATFTAQSLAGQYDIVLIPSVFNLNSGGQFKDVATGFTGGWSRLVQDIALTNEFGHTEDYDVWVSANDNINGLTFEII